jgi:PAS domain S-box-containing protein
VFDRLRLLLLALALGFGLLALPAVVLSRQRHWLLSLLAIAVLAWLSWRWICWYRTGRPHTLDLPVEGAAAALLTATTGSLASAFAVVYAGLSYRSFSVPLREASLSLLGYSLGIAVGSMVRGTHLWSLVIEVGIQFPGLALVCVAGSSLGASLRDEQRRAAELAAAEQRYRLLVEHMPVVTFLADAEGGLRYISPRVTSLLGYDPTECVGDWPAFLAYLVHPGERAKTTGTALRALRDGRPFSAECRIARRTGEPLWMRVEVTLVRETASGEACWIGTLIDESDQERLAQELVQQAFHDPLTALPNRALLLDRLEHALARLRRRPGTVAVLFLDLDNFKVINDTLGHRTGDQLLQQLARRLLDGVRPSDTVARFGGTSSCSCWKTWVRRRPPARSRRG